MTKNNIWFDEHGYLKISSEELYCTVIYSYDTSEIGHTEIKEDIINFVKENYRDYEVGTDIVAIYYAINFAKETKSNYNECILLCRSGVTRNPDWDKLEKIYKNY